ncbi:hypothetical protein KGQ19_15935 [Catenulispora sp. NL8]|uniref:Uncharacterized protein n=1 Tax=Catenulispora pinistramenti TaxID=2705254 RepID=A0ABS5KQN1_9ACTN|nr:hypothetical protein [Catenulispora pinistramenti]MBS2548356.1 hypothetical protein [Catenulispora pinistramenti]
MNTQIQPAAVTIPRQRTCDNTASRAEAGRDQAWPGDVDDRGYTLCFSSADDMGTWLTPEEAAGSV